MQALIRKDSNDSHKLFFTTHVKKQMRKRNITMLAVLDVLQNGCIKRTPEPNASKGTVECRMEYYCGGCDIGVVVAISDEDIGLFVVTAMYT